MDVAYLLVPATEAAADGNTTAGKTATHRTDADGETDVTELHHPHITTALYETEVTEDIGIDGKTEQFLDLAVLAVTKANAALSVQVVDRQRG